MRSLASDEEQADQVREWFAAKGFLLHVEQRNVRDLLPPGAATASYSTGLI